MKLKVGVVGATGLVGREFLRSLEERRFPVEDLRPFASESSLGKSVGLAGKSYAVRTLEPGCFKGLHLVFFSSGDSISREWAPQAVAAGAWAIDNSAAFRMDERYPLLVPEVNGSLLKKLTQPTIIANPNCSTIQLVMVLKPLVEAFGLKAVRLATYQAVSGAGQPGIDELEEQKKEQADGRPLTAKAFAHPILTSCVPEIGSLGEGDFFTEELKVMRETRKILGLPQLPVSAMAVRVPVANCHAEAVWVTLNAEVSKDSLLARLKETPGVVVQDDPRRSLYPLQAVATGTDPVYVGRIHRDIDDPSTWLMWIVADNIRKGAALNGLQIAESLLQDFDFA